MPLQATSGAASYDGFGGGVVAEPNYIESCFSTYLYTGTGANQTITNGIDLSTKGGLVWLKDRTNNDWGHSLFDTARGAGNRLKSSTTGAQTTGFGQTFTTSGFGLDGNANYNYSGDTFVGWTFRKQPKFFDVVTFTADLSNTNQRISHNLGSVPGTIIIKCTNVGGSYSDWWTYHRSLGRSAYLTLNSTTASTSSTNFWGTSDPTSTDFGFNAFDWGLSGGTYVAYLFAHDAGGFGLTGTDNVISCGSFTTDGSSNATITLGWEPQWVLFKSSSSSAQGWKILDNMRGFPAAVSSGPNAVQLIPNSSAGETGFGQVGPNATGWGTTIGQFGLASATYIYIAIRRGPMAVPTLGTSVFSPTYTSSAANPLTVTTNFPVDLSLNRATTGSPTWVFSRLTGANSNTAASTTSSYLQTSSTAAQSAPSVNGDSMQSNTALIDVNFNAGDTTPKIYLNFKRAPSFFDVVCYTGTGSARSISHNLTVAPEMVIIKSRSAAYAWPTLVTPIGNTDFLFLNTNGAKNSASSYFNSTYPTSSVFSVGTNVQVNESGSTFVAYLFATCAGVSKVGSYTGTGTTKQIDCGFTSGARFVMIKRYDDGSTGDWYVWDSARGIVSGNDPYLLLNSTAAEVTSTDYVDTYSAGFEISSTAPAAINASGGTFMFLAIA